MALLGETARVLVLVGATAVSGTACGLAASLAFLAQTRGAGSLVDSAALGFVLGWMISGLVAPMLWRRPLGAAMLRTFPAGIAAAALLGLIAQPQTATFAGVAAIAIASLVVRATLPQVYPEQRPGLCQRCGYPLRGLVGPTCPECGAELDGGDSSAP